MANPLTTDVGRLTDDLSSLNPTIVQKEILEVAEMYSRTRPQVTDFKFEGAGLTTNLPYMQEFAFASTLEAAAAAYSEPDVDADPATIVKYTADVPISMEARSFSAGDIVGAVRDEGARAYAKKVNQLIHAEFTASVKAGMRVDTGATMTVAHLFAAGEKLLGVGAPEPYIAVLCPAHATDILDPGATALANLAGLDYRQDFITGTKGPTGYLGNIANFSVFVDPYLSAGQSIYFARKGIYWVRKDAEIPGQKGELTVEIDWDREIRSWVLSMTFFGVAKLRRVAGTDLGWAGRLYDVP